ncbi:MAG: hypothetical protein K9J74_09630 [Sulfuritalea sp.]|nr:hypothetical protein [Sulfuritalea sp.]
MEVAGSASPQNGNLTVLSAASQNSQTDKNAATKPSRNESETQAVKFNQASTENRPTPGAAVGGTINTSA